MEKADILFFDEEGWANCVACGDYADDEGSDEGNPTDAKSELAEPTPELESFLGSFEGTKPEQLREEYFQSKARFLLANGRRSQRIRFPNRSHWARRGMGRGRKGRMDSGK